MINNLCKKGDTHLLQKYLKTAKVANLSWVLADIE